MKPIHNTGHAKGGIDWRRGRIDEHSLEADPESQKDHLFYGHNIRRIIMSKYRKAEQSKGGKQPLIIQCGRLKHARSLVNSMHILTRADRETLFELQASEGVQVDDKKMEPIISAFRKAQMNGFSKLLANELPPGSTEKNRERVFSREDWDLYDVCICRLLLRCMWSMFNDGSAFKRSPSFSGPDYDGVVITAAANVERLASMAPGRCGVESRGLRKFVSQFPQYFTLADGGSVVFTGYDFESDPLSVNNIPLLNDLELLESLLGNPRPVRLVLDELDTFVMPTEGDGYHIAVAREAWEADRWLNHYVHDGVKHVGMDCEWDCVKPWFATSDESRTRSNGYNLSTTKNYKERRKNSKKRNRARKREQRAQSKQNNGSIHAKYPDIIQIATDESCLIYQTKEGTHAPSQGFMDFLGNSSIAKMWYGNNQDVLLMRAWFAKHSKVARFENFVDLQTKNHKLGLDVVTPLVLNKRLTKNPELQLSRWSRIHLEHEQIRYAAEDVFAILQIHKTGVNASDQSMNYILIE